MAAPERIRVLRVIARLNVGGPALHVSHLTRGLDERGYETTLVAGSLGKDEGSMEYVAQELGVTPVHISKLQREVSVGFEREAIGRVLELIRATRPHILHTHTAKAGAIGRAAALLAGRDRPLVVVHTFHGHVLRGYFSPARTKAFQVIERMLAPSTDALVAVSPEVRDDLVTLGVAPASKFVVIRLGLDLERRTAAPPGARDAFRRELGLPPHRFLVGWLGRMTEIKRSHDLIEAVALAQARGADVDLVLAGDGPCRTALVELADERLGTHCHFIGFRSDVAPIYAGTDAIALTSANEGTPVTLIEALAAGKPVVATSVGGVPDVVRDGETGLLATAGDVGGIGRRIADLATDAGLAERLGSRGRETVPQRYAVPRLLDDVDILYRSFLDEKGPGRAHLGPIGRTLVPTIAAGTTPIRRRDRPLRIAIVSQYFPPEVGATQSRMQSFADFLAAAGHDVTVICEFPNHPHGVIPTAYRGRLVEDDRSNPYRVLRVWVCATEDKTQFSRMAFYLSYMSMATLVSPRLGRPDVVFATSPPLFAGLAGAAIAAISGAPFVLDVRDLWPAAAVSLGQLSSPSAMRASSAIERHLYRRATAVVAVTRPFCSHIDAIRDKAPKTSLVPNGTLESFFDSHSTGGRADLGVDPSRFLAMFAGNLGIAQALPTILDAAAIARDSIDVAVVGDGPIRETLIADASARGLDNVHFHPQVPLDQMPALLAASDALLVTLSAHPTFTDFVPSKMLDYMAAAKPVVLAAAGESARILRSARAGIEVPPEDPQALAEALLYLQRNPNEAHAFGESGRAFARTRLRSVHAERLEALLLDVAGRNRR